MPAISDGLDFDWLARLLALELGGLFHHGSFFMLLTGSRVGCQSNCGIHAAERMNGLKRRRCRVGLISTTYRMRSDWHRRGPLLRTRVWWTHASLHHALNRKQSQA